MESCTVILIKKKNYPRDKAKMGKLTPLIGMPLDYEFLFKVIKIEGEVLDSEIKFINYSSSEYGSDKSNLYNIARNYGEQAMFSGVSIGKATNGKRCANMSKEGIKFEGYANNR